MLLWFCKQKIDQSLPQYYQNIPDKEAFDFDPLNIKNDPEKIWTSTELHDEYIEKGEIIVGFLTGSKKYRERVILL